MALPHYDLRDWAGYADESAFQRPASESPDVGGKAISEDCAIDYLVRSQGIPLKRPVLVLGWISRIVVPIARSLQRHGIAVDVASFVPAVPPASRAISEFRRIPEPRLDPNGFLRDLREILRQGRHDLLIPADDQALVAITQNYDALKDDVCLACPPPRITNRILNKVESIRIAEQCGIHVPRTRLISTTAELADLASTISFPWVLKPARKEISGEDTKSLIFTTPSEVRSKFPRPWEFSSPMLLQEYCPGYGLGIEMLIHEGECRAIFQHRRLKEVPYSGGVSVTAVADKADGVLVEKSLTLLRALQWNGPAMVEFRVNPRTGSAMFMEVNGRYWGTIGLPIAAGVNFPLYQWQLLHGEDPAMPEAYAEGTQWQWPAGHIWRLHGMLLSARHSPAALQELRNTIAEFTLFDVEKYHRPSSVSDSMPVVADVIQILKFLCQDDLKALMRRLKRHLESIQ